MVRDEKENRQNGGVMQVVFVGVGNLMIVKRGLVIGQAPVFVSASLNLSVRI
jgi:hypothetical protein